jgi:hypothetical protein
MAQKLPKIVTLNNPKKKNTMNWVDFNWVILLKATPRLSEVNKI